jgi:hypothetical protein
MKNFALDLQKPGQAVGRSPSAQITRNPNPRYQGEDATPSEPAFTRYFDFYHPGPSHIHHQPWEDQILFDTDTSAGAQWGPGNHWGPGNYANYHPQEHGETSSGIHRGRMSFSVRGFHDSYHGPFPFHAPQDKYQQLPQHHYQSPPYHHHPPLTGYDEPDFFQEVDDRLTSLEMGQQEIRSTLHQQVEWQQQTT